MPPERRAPIDPHLANLDRPGTIELCQSLSDYAEAGGLSRELMLQAGRYALGRWEGDLDVLLAVARMYQIGGELARARAALIQAGKLAPEDARLLRLLRDVLRALGVTDSPEDVLAEGDDEPDPSPPALLPAPRVKPGGHRISQAPTVPRMAAVTGPAAQESVPSPRATKSQESLRPSRAPAAQESLRPSRAPGSKDSGRPSRPSRIKLLDHDDPARLLEPYELIGEIAVGGMASVYLARLTGAGGFQRLVAIKRLHPHLAREEEFVEMFIDEARLAAGIHHPNVVPILEIGQSDTGYFLVMELIEGDTLAVLASRAFSRSVMLPRGVVARIIFDILTGLHAAHQLKDPSGKLLGLVHRDCTPQNILVGADGSSRITDFGVARAASRYAVTRAQVVKGKVAYLSPEQATGVGLDRRSDLFTVGIVLWEALTGRPLFLADNDGLTVSRVLSHPIPSIRNFSPDVTTALDDLCGRALQRDANKRFPTAAAMAEALERAARSLPGGLASPGEVARCVEDLIGAEAAAQREEVRGWIAQQESAPRARRSLASRPGSGPDLKDPVLPLPSRLPAASESEAFKSTPPAAPSLAEPPKKAAASATPDPVAPPAAPGPVAKADEPAAEKRAGLPGLLSIVRRRKWIPLAALVVIVLASSPLWFKKLNNLRHRLLQSSKVVSGAASAEPHSSAAPSAPTSWRGPVGRPSRLKASAPANEAPLSASRAGPAISASASVAPPDAALPR